MMGLPIGAALGLAGYLAGGSKEGTLLPLLLAGAGGGALLGGLGGHYGWFKGKPKTDEEGAQQQTAKPEYKITDPQVSLETQKLPYMDEAQLIESADAREAAYQNGDMSDEDYYAANKAYNDRLIELVAEERKKNPDYEPTAHYMRESPNGLDYYSLANHSDPFSGTSTVTGFDMPNGASNPYGNKDPWVMFTPDQIAPRFAELKRMEDAGQLKPGATRAAVQEYINNFGKANANTHILGGDAAVREVGKNKKGYRTWNVPISTGIKYRSVNGKDYAFQDPESNWKSDIVNVYYVPGWGYYSQDGGKDNQVTNMEEILEKARAPENSVSFEPILQDLANTYGATYNL